jgi:hypothetical protein
MMWEEPTNNERADWAYEACAVFAEATGLNLEGDDKENDLSSAIGDLVINLYHLCEQRGLDIDTFEHAKSSYEEEVSLELEGNEG